jgi:hypothetical protein
MATRREVLGAAALVSMLPVFPTGSGIFASALPPLPMPFYKIIFDSRYAPAIAFGNEAARQGFQAQGFDGDLTNLWFYDLHPVWRDRPVAVAGLTNHRALICLQSFASDHRLRVIYQGEHRMHDDGSVEHQVWGPMQSLQEISGIESQNIDWPRKVAQLLKTFPGSPSNRTRATCKSTLKVKSGTHVGSLFSWVIAPAQRV